jgi:hypothetical protein
MSQGFIANAHAIIDRVAGELGRSRGRSHTFNATFAGNLARAFAAENYAVLDRGHILHWKTVSGLHALDRRARNEPTVPSHLYTTPLLGSLKNNARIFTAISYALYGDGDASAMLRYVAAVCTGNQLQHDLILSDKAVEPDRVLSIVTEHLPLHVVLLDGGTGIPMPLRRMSDDDIMVSLWIRNGMVTFLRPQLTPEARVRHQQAAKRLVSPNVTSPPSRRREPGTPPEYKPKRPRRVDDDLVVMISDDDGDIHVPPARAPSTLPLGAAFDNIHVPPAGVPSTLPVGSDTDDSDDIPSPEVEYISSPGSPPVGDVDYIPSPSQDLGADMDSDRGHFSSQDLGADMDSERAPSLYVRAEDHILPQDVEGHFSSQDLGADMDSERAPSLYVRAEDHILPPDVEGHSSSQDLGADMDSEHAPSLYVRAEDHIPPPPDVEDPFSSQDLGVDMDSDHVPSLADMDPFQEVGLLGALGDEEWNQVHRDEDDGPSPLQPPVIRNLGNTCFKTAMLYVLWLIGIDFSVAGGNFVNRLRDVLRAMELDRVPDAVLGAFYWLLNSHPDYRAGRTGDPMIALTKTLEMARDMGEDPGLRFRATFSTGIRSTSECGARSEQLATDDVVFLEMSNENTTTSVKQLWSEWSSVPSTTVGLCHHNTCPNGTGCSAKPPECKAVNEETTTRQVHLVSVSRYLALSIKRRQFDAFSSTESTNRRFVGVEPTLVISETLKKVGDVVAIVMHGREHYTTYLKLGADWWYCDDVKVGAEVRKQTPPVPIANMQVSAVVYRTRDATAEEIAELSAREQPFIFPDREPEPLPMNPPRAMETPKPPAVPRASETPEPRASSRASKTPKPPALPRVESGSPSIFKPAPETPPTPVSSESGRKSQPKPRTKAGRMHTNIKQTEGTVTLPNGFTFAGEIHTPSHVPGHRPSIANILQAATGHDPRPRVYVRTAEYQDVIKRLASLDSLIYTGKQASDRVSIPTRPQLLRELKSTSRSVKLLQNWLAAIFDTNAPPERVSGILFNPPDSLEMEMLAPHQIDPSEKISGEIQVNLGGLVSVPMTVMARTMVPDLSDLQLVVTELEKLTRLNNAFHVRPPRYDNPRPAPEEVAQHLCRRLRVDPHDADYIRALQKCIVRRPDTSAAAAFDKVYPRLHALNTVRRSRPYADFYTMWSPVLQYLLKPENLVLLLIEAAEASDNNALAVRVLHYLVQIQDNAVRALVVSRLTAVDRMLEACLDPGARTMDVGDCPTRLAMLHETWWAT